MEDNLDKLIEQAYSLHKNGQLDEAKSAYEDLLKLYPENLNLLNYYAYFEFSLKHYDEALNIYKDIYSKTLLEDIKIHIIKILMIKKDYIKAIEAAEENDSENEIILRLTAQAYMNIKNYDKAVEYYMKLIFYGINNFDDIFNLSLSYSYLGDIENSIKYALDFFTQNQQDISVCYHLASLYAKKGDNIKQLEYLLKAKEIEPNIHLLYNIGVLYRQTGNYDEALDYFNEVLKQDGNYKPAILNISRIYKNKDKNKALNYYIELVEKYPDDTTILSQLYIAYRDLFKNEEAYKTALKLITIDEKSAYPYAYAADALYALGKYQEAIRMFEKEKQYDNNHQDSDIMIANIYSLLNQGDKAIEIFKTKYPELVQKHDSYAYIQLIERNLEEARSAMHNHLTELSSEDELDKRALQFFYKLNLDKKYNIDENEFKKYKTDKSKKDNKKITYYLKNELYGNNSDNKKILLYNANGIGDLIMFSRYIHTLEKHTKKILIQSPKSMERLLKYNFPEYEFFSDDDIINENNYDYTSSFYCLFLSLKEITLKEIPFSQSYLKVDEALVKEKSEFDFIKTDKKKIGIFWMGNPVIMPQRSIKPDKLKPLFELPNTQIYSFQIDNYDYESSNMVKDLEMIDLAPYIKDYADTAAFLKNIDTLVTIDSSIAHLAGAMGVKTYLLLPFESEWRWFHCTETTPWYNSIKIFKQKIPFDWDEVIERVKNELTI